MKKLVSGNSFTFSIKTDVVKWENGQRTTEDFDLSAMKYIRVSLFRNGTRIGNVAHTIQDESTLIWHNDAVLFAGVYGLEIICTDNNGCKYRYFNDAMFEVVEKTKDGNLPVDVEFTETEDVCLGIIYIAGININEGGSATEKPATGWAKTDLAADVQTSLGKADTALQSHQDISGKVDKIVGKQLSTNDYTNEDKAKVAAALTEHQSLDGYETQEHAEDTYQPKGNYALESEIPNVPSWAMQPSKPTYNANEVGALPVDTTIPTKTSELTNDSGFLTEHQDISGKQDVISDLATIRSGAALGATALQPVQGKGLSTNDYTDADKAEVAKVSQVGAEIGDLSGLSTQIKTNLVAAINEVNGKTVQMDAAMSATSTNGVQNKVIKAYVDAAEASAISTAAADATVKVTALENGAVKDNADNITALTTRVGDAEVAAASAQTAATEAKNSAEVAETKAAAVSDQLQYIIDNAGTYDPTISSLDSKIKALSSATDTKFTQVQQLIIGETEISTSFIKGKRYLGSGYSNHANYACSLPMQLVGDVKISNCPEGYSYLLMKYVSDTQGEGIGKSHWDATPFEFTANGTYIMNFIHGGTTSITDDDLDVFKNAIKIVIYSEQSVSYQLATKVDKVDGKVLSSNDYTDDEKVSLSLLNSIVPTMQTEVSTLKEKVTGDTDVSYTITKGKRYNQNGYATVGSYACTSKISASNTTLSVKNVPTGYQYILYKYVSDSSGSAVKSSWSRGDITVPDADGEYIVTFINDSVSTLTDADIATLSLTEIKTVSSDCLESRVTALENQPPVKTLEDYFPNPKYFNLLQQKCPKFCELARKKTKDVVVVMSGSSLSMGNRYASDREDATTRPPLLHTNDLASHIFDTLINLFPEQKYRRYDHSDLTYTGTWEVTNDAKVDGTSIWDDKASVKNPLTKTTTTASASVSISVPADAWQFNFIYKTDTTCGNCTVSIAQGNGKMEAWNGTAWVEANGYSLSMLDTAASGTKGNTCYQKRLKMRCKNKASGGINSIGTAKTLTITKASDTTRMNVVGFEWSPREFMLTLINSSRGGWQWGYPASSSTNLEKTQDSDVWAFNPDLLLLEVTMINWGASRDNYANRDPNYYVNLAKRAYFNEFNDNDNSIYARSNGYTDCEVVFYGDTMHFVSEYRCFNDDGSPKYYDVTTAATNGSATDNTFVGSKVTAYDHYNIVDEYMLGKTGYIYLPVNEQFKRVSEKYYGSYFKAMTEEMGKSGKGISAGGTHLNDNGAALWANIICPLLEM